MENDFISHYQINSSSVSLNEIGKIPTFSSLDLNKMKSFRVMENQL